MWEKIADVLLDTLLDCVKLLPFLLAAYLLIEWLEHRAGDRFGTFLKKSGRLGPLIGGLLGLVPQCGFSVVCANFYAGGLVSMGTVIAVMLATSDEALPLLLTEGIGNGMQIAEILLLLATKLVIGVAAGFAVDAVIGEFWRRTALKTAPDAAKSEEEHEAHVHAHTERECEGREHEDHAEHSEHGHNHNTLCEHCGCEEQRGFVRGILLPALKHVGSIMLFIFAVTRTGLRRGGGGAVHWSGHRVADAFPRKPQHTPESDDNGHNVCGGKPERHHIAADHCLKPQRGKSAAPI